jgi:hypothetical protein
MRYPDGPHNAEALLVHPTTHRIYIVTKSKDDAAVYIAPSTLSTSNVNTLTKVAAAPNTVTDGTFLDDGRMVLRNYTHGYVSKGPGKLATPFVLPKLRQGESVTAVDGDNAVFVGSEGTQSPVWCVPLPPTP